MSDKKLVVDQRLFNQLSNKLSHQLRQPICTMMGLLNLIKLEGVTEADSQVILTNLNTCILELDKISREMGEIIQRVDGRECLRG
jgi:hypothetical protein